MATSASGPPLLAVGLNHRTAPVDVRERLALDADGVRRRLVELRRDGVMSEGFLLSTCNRVELYAVHEPGQRAVERWIETFRGPRGEPLQPYLYWLHGQDAVRHLFQVTSSLDSMVVGEPQILGQVKQAIRLAEEAGSLGRVMHRLTERSLSVAKRVRSETDIGQSTVGVGNAGVELALQIFGDLNGRRALLLGTGEMGQQVAKALLNSGLEELLVANRTYERAVELAEQTGGTPIRFERVEEYLARVDIVVGATGAPQHVLTADMVKRTMRARWYRSLFLVDLSVPRNIDPDIENIEQAFLFNVDDLREVVQAGMAAREQAARAAHALVDEEAERFVGRLVEIESGPRIGGVVRAAEQLRLAELERSAKLVESLSDAQRKQLDAMTRALVKKVLHQPLSAAREAARKGDQVALQTILSALEDET